MRLSYDEIIQRCRAYVAKVNEGAIQRAQWEHFCAWCYEDPDELEQIIADYREEMQRQRREARKEPPKPPKPKGRPRKNPKPETDAKSAETAEDATKDDGKADGKADCGRMDSKRMECGAELVRLANFIQAQLATSPYWGGAQSQKAIFLLKQNRTGRGMRDKIEQQVDGDVAIKVSFGGGLEDPFG